jgi:DNA-binding transcriptional MerR regulator
MSGLIRINRKASDADIIRWNSLGLSLAKIGEILDIHPTTVMLRLKGLGIEPADTRRTFMQEIVLALPGNQQDKLVDKLGPQFSIKDYVRNLISRDLI